MELLYWAPDYYGTAQYFNYFGLIPGSSWSQLSAPSPTAKPVINQTETSMFNKALAASSAQAERDQFFNLAGQQMIKDAVDRAAVQPRHRPRLPERHQGHHLQRLLQHEALAAIPLVTRTSSCLLLSAAARVAPRRV